MPSELCPKCRSLRNMQVSTVITKRKDKKGKEKEILISSYYCEVCNSFVRSEEDIAYTRQIGHS